MRQDQFAGLIGVPVSTFLGWIHYDRIPDARTACDMATALGVSVEYLIRGADRENVKLRLNELKMRKTMGRIEKQVNHIQREIIINGKPL